MCSDALLVAVAVLFWGVSPAAERLDAESPRESAPKPGGRATPAKSSGSKVAWLRLEEGLALLREKYRPAVIVYEPVPEDGRESGDKAVSPSALLEDSNLRSVVKEFVCIRIWTEDLEKPYPLPGAEGDPEDRKAEGKPSGKPGPGEEPAPARDGAEPGAKAPKAGEERVGARLGLTAGSVALLALSFREEVVLRHGGDAEFPTRMRLARELRRVATVNAQLAAAAREVEKAIAESRYAAGLKKRRDAVRRILKYDDQRVQESLEPVTREKIATLIGEYKDSARRAMREADILESGGKFEPAIKAYDAVMADYPFPDILKQANRRKNEILRKMTFGV